LQIEDSDGNGDGPEAGLWAMEDALEAYQQATTATKPFRVWILVTDNYAHRSREAASNFQRDFRMEFLVAGINRVIGPSETMILFDSTPLVEPADPWSNGQQLQPMHNGERVTPPAQQWVVLRQLSGGKVRGKNVKFPINASVMLQEIPQTVLDHRRSICL